MKKCRKCERLLSESKFYFQGRYNKRSGTKVLSARCRECFSITFESERKRPYKPRKKEEIKEEILINNKDIYILIKKIELNNLKISYIDSFRLVSEYIKVFGDDINEFYSEKEQLDIMFFKLKEYIEHEKNKISRNI